MIYTKYGYKIITSARFSSLLLLVMFYLMAHLHADEIDGIISVSVDKKKYSLGENVQIKLEPREGVEVKDIKFSCCVYAFIKDNGWVEVIPSLKATAPKQIEPVYQLSAKNNLTWNYSDKPDYFKPVKGNSYRVIIRIITPQNTPSSYSEVFEFE